MRLTPSTSSRGAGFDPLEVSEGVSLDPLVVSEGVPYVRSPVASCQVSWAVKSPLVSRKSKNKGFSRSNRDALIFFMDSFFTIRQIFIGSRLSICEATA